MPIFCVESVKIYTGQKRFTRIYLWDPWQISGMVLSNMDRNSKEIYKKNVNDAWPVVKIVVAICRQIVSVTANMFFLGHNSSTLSALMGWWNMYQNVATVPWCQIFLWYQVLGAAIALVWRLSDIWCCWCWGWWCWCYVAWEKVEWFEDRLHIKRLTLFFTNSGQTLHACHRSNYFSNLCFLSKLVQMGPKRP